MPIAKNQVKVPKAARGTPGSGCSTGKPIAAFEVFGPATHRCSNSSQGDSLLRRNGHDRDRRRGVVLLVVLVLLTLFTMMLLAFVLATSHHRRNVNHTSRAEQTGDDPADQLHAAFLQIVRGPRNPDSVIGPHSLLEDMYGASVFGRITASNPAKPDEPLATGYFYTAKESGPTVPFLSAGNHYREEGHVVGSYPNYTYQHTPIIGIRVTSVTGEAPGGDFPDGYKRPAGFYNGRVITMLDGPAKGRSSRIIGSWFTNGYTYFQLLSFDGLLPYDPTILPIAEVYPSYRFLINGRAFSGTGFGYRPLGFQPMAKNPAGVVATNQTARRLLDAFDPMTPLLSGTPADYVATNYDPTSATDPITQMFGSGNASGTVFQYALLPNPRRGVFTPFRNASNPNNPAWEYLDPAGPGGANEEYDAPDFQNMLLAMRIWADPSGRGNYHLTTPLPSLHRPDLIHYWNSRWRTQSTPPLSALGRDLVTDATSSSGGNTSYAVARSTLRKVVLRPLSFPDDPTTADVDESENPNFTGSNPAFHLINGPWDVDNDGDGVPDSVWVDVGFPTQTGPDGRRYKALIAALVVDMDGKLNLNAHSSWSHVPTDTSTSRFSPVVAPFAQPFITQSHNPVSYVLKMGSGYGPPEISLHPVFEPALELAETPLGELRQLLGGDMTNRIDGRYGEVQIAASLGKPPGPGITSADEPFNWLSELDYPRLNNLGAFPHQQNLYLPTTTTFGVPNAAFELDPNAFVGPATKKIWTTRSAFGSPPDLNGNGMLALDLRGQPLYIDYRALANPALAGNAGWGERNELVDDPYELDLSATAQNGHYSGVASIPAFGSNALAADGRTNSIVARDSPFTPAELERVLRGRDVDAATLPDRLIRLAPNVLTSRDPYAAVRGTMGRGPSFPEIEQISNLLTTHQFDLPTPYTVFTSPDLQKMIDFVVRRMRDAGVAYAPPPVPNCTLSNLITARILRDCVVGGIDPAIIGKLDLDFAVSELLAPELLAGERINVNRTLGNGSDDNANNAVDEPGETEAAWGPLHGGLPVELDVNNDGWPNSNDPRSEANGYFDIYPEERYAGDDAKARPLLARHLYTLMMLLKDDRFLVYADLDGDGYQADAPLGPGELPTDKQQRDIAYYFAQWAINIVDFRDSDAIMTPFEFDIFPFREDVDDLGDISDYLEYYNVDTWDVDGALSVFIKDSNGYYLQSSDDSPKAKSLRTSRDGAPSVYRGLVWGAERPELLITETIATHDRRTRDTHVDNGNKRFVAPPATRPVDTDTNYDQVRRPQGSLLVELYNPNPPLTVGNRLPGQAPNELYTSAGVDPATNAPVFGLNLAMRAPPHPGGRTAGAPVWRLAFVSRPAVTELTQKMSQRQAVLPYAYPDPHWDSDFEPRFNPNVDPTFPVKGQVPDHTPVIDRVAYFTSQVPTGPSPSLNQLPSSQTTPPSLDVDRWRQFFPQITKNGKPEEYAVIPPNHYAVVGSASPLPDPYAPVGFSDDLSTTFGYRNFGEDSSPTGADYPTSIKDKYHRRIIFAPEFSVFDDVAGEYYTDYNRVANKPYAILKRAIGIPMAPLLFDGSKNLILTYDEHNEVKYSAATRALRFSLTEPSRGYPYSVGQSTLKGTSGESVKAYDENAYFSGASPGIPDIPYDDAAAGNFTGASDTNDATRQKDITGRGAFGSEDGTQPRYTIVYLQRLANPLAPWDANANPYIIVDQMWVDLTTYNSEKSPPMKPATGGIGTDTNEYTTNGQKFNFDSRQRSPSSPPTSPTTVADFTSNNLWYPFAKLDPANGVNIKGNPGSLMKSATWGYLNPGYGYASTGSSSVQFTSLWGGDSSTPLAPVQINGQPTGQPLTNLTADYVGAPTLPFPWFNWNNRPFVSGKELMLVPMGSPASMLAEMTLGTPTTWPANLPVPSAAGPWPAIGHNAQPAGAGGAAIGSPFEPQNPTATQVPLPKGEFGHLPNVFSSPAYASTTSERSQPSANLYRLLEYVHVPSRFTGSETWLPPANLQGNTDNDLAYTAKWLPLHMLHPPFNRVSRFRDPGRVNINTIFDPFVWQGIMDERFPAHSGNPPWRNLWNFVCNSRLGTGNSAMDASNAYLETNLAALLGSPTEAPSILNAPFRSYSGRTLAPLVSQRTQNSGAWGEREIDATLLRAVPSSNSYPLFEYPGPGNAWAENGAQADANNLRNPADPASGVPTLPAQDNPYRNPYFAYKQFVRLDNLLTTRSNVYAIWLTIGYFEVTEATGNDPQQASKYPDGWVLGAELGADSGDIHRHRAFYMYDRTAPVGFERGENHNTHQGILLQRFIE